MECPTVKQLLDSVEVGRFERDLEIHLGDCQACSAVVSALRDETEGLTISVGALWLRERVSCPHQDILASYHDGSLDTEEADFIQFHLEIVECPHCLAGLSELESAADVDQPQRLERAKDAALQRSAAFLRQE
ncbi:MAG: hypothetical protein V3W41_13465 [Planctomycetota bacterium]